MKFSIVANRWNKRKRKYAPTKTVGSWWKGKFLEIFLFFCFFWFCWANAFPFLLFLLITKCERSQSFLENTNTTKVHPILDPTSTIYRYIRTENKNILNSHNKCQCTEFPKWINCGCRQYIHIHICIYTIHRLVLEVCYRFFLFRPLILFAIKCDVVHISDSWILI